MTRSKAPLYKPIDGLLRRFRHRTRRAICATITGLALAALAVLFVLLGLADARADEVRATGERRLTKVAALHHTPPGHRRSESWSMTLQYREGPTDAYLVDCPDGGCGLREGDLVIVYADPGDRRLFVTEQGWRSDGFSIQVETWALISLPLWFVTAVFVLPAWWRVTARPDAYWARPGHPATDAPTSPASRPTGPARRPKDFRRTKRRR